MWQFFSSAFDRNKGAFDRRRALRLCKGSVLARRHAMSSHAGANVLGLAVVRSTASTAFDRTVCSLNFPEPEQNAKNNLKK
jgi:methyl coenzyme M reductase subunit C